MTTRAVLAIFLSIVFSFILVPAFYWSGIWFTSSAPDFGKFAKEILLMGWPTLALSIVCGSLLLRHWGQDKLGAWLTLFMALSVIVILLSQPIGALLRHDTVANQVIEEIFGSNRSPVLLILIAVIFALPPGALIGLISYKVHQVFGVLPKPHQKPPQQPQQ